MLGGERVLCESQQERGFANASVPDDYQLDKVVVRRGAPASARIHTIILMGNEIIKI